MATFIPRRVFPVLDSLPKSYFLGHHHAGLAKMKTMLSSVDLIIECRDYRVPVTSRNPLLEEQLAGKERIIVYTKMDLGMEFWAHSRSQPDAKTLKMQNTIRDWHQPSRVVFHDYRSPQSTSTVLSLVKEHAARRSSPVSSHMMVVGMPNVGKSSLLNALRGRSLGKPKAAKTGAQPGITRKIGTLVKIVDGGDDKDSVYMIDTPGVFIPYVPNHESMLKLALCGCVKDTIISGTIIADYLLYRVNLVDPTLYAKYSSPTNDIIEFLERLARRTGRLQKQKGEEASIPDVEAAALWMVQRWRDGKFGKFVLDDVSLANFEQEKRDSLASLSQSVNQATKSFKGIRKVAKSGLKPELKTSI